MFIGREKELNALEEAYSSEKFEFAVIYGRRRVGKTFLINEFIKDKRAISFTGVESNERQNLENLSLSIAEYSSSIAPSTVFSSFQSALEYVFKISERERIIMVMDEYPYVARSSKSLQSTLQLLIDKYKETSKLFLILCGSSMSYMTDNVLAYKSPLYGRRTLQLKVEPFDFFSSTLFFKNYSNEDKAVLYGILGGTPQYLREVDDSISLEENIKRIYLRPSSFLFEEPLNLLKQEVREPTEYNAVITAIATGCSKLNEIASRISEETGKTSMYVKNLISLGILRKETPYGENAERKTIYSIEDNMFRFWYKFIFNNRALITRGGDSLVCKIIENDLSSYMGPVFEEICKQYLWKLLLSGRSPVFFKDLGRWWGTNARTHKAEEVDILGRNGDSLLIAECKWDNQKTERNVLETLIERGSMFPQKDKHFFLFSKTGFTEGCVDSAEKYGSVNLVKFDDFF